MVLTLAFLPAFVFAYSPETTHNALTDDIVDLYNYTYPSKKFSDSEKTLVKRGSIEEDRPSERVINHFYDPIYNVGLKSINYTSKQWAMSANAQSFNNQFAGVGGLLLETFSSPTDFSWERAIFDYAYKDKERGLIALGHILHLIEDATVPDHVRDDAHPPAFDFGSPYEAYASRYNESTIETFNQLVRERVRPVELGSIGEYFDTVATFTNTNFFSKDTIFDEKYAGPVIANERIGFLQDGTERIFGFSDRGFKLLMINYSFDKETGLVSKGYSIVDKDNLILSDYWQVLSRTAVKNGAGIIKLFFEEVEKEKQTGTLLAKNKSAWDKLMDKAGGSVKAIFSATATSTAQNNLASVASIPSPSTASAQSSQSPSPSTFIVSAQNTPPPAIAVVSEPTPSTSQVPKSSPENLPTPPPTTLPPLLAISPGFGGGSTMTTASSDTTTETDTDSQVAALFSATDATSTTQYISILSPQSGSQIGATTTITFSGTSTPASTIGLDLANATTSAGTTGDWQLTLTLASGTTTLIFYSADATRATSTATVSVYLDTTAPTFSFSVPLCEQSLAVNGCVTATTTVPISLASDATDVNYFTLAIDGVYSTTTTATSTLLVSDTLHTIEVSAIDQLGNRSATSTQTIFTSTFPIVINEVAWAGSTASTTAEWIELYNKTPFTIDLSSWILYGESLEPYISLAGTIASHNFYLLERRDDTAVNTISADQVYGNGGSQWALSNSGDRLILSYASTTIDQTALTYESSDAGFWAGGESQSTKKISMERYDPFVAGDDEFNWDNNLEILKNGTDVAGNSIYGAPKAKNSLAYLINKNQDLEASMTLTLANSPYLVVDTFLDIPEGHTLTIEPGVVVKFREGGFDFGGRLISQGTQSQPVVFTSFADDAYGGDLNTDGASTTPYYTDWSGIAFSSGATGSNIDGLKLLHSGGLYANATDISGSYVEITDAEDAVYVTNGVLSLTHSIFQNNRNQSLQFYNSTATLTDFAFVGTTTTTEVLDAYNHSHITVTDFSVSGVPNGDGFVIYLDSSLVLEDGTISGVGGSAVDVFVRVDVSLDVVSIDAGGSNNDAITGYSAVHATTTNVTVTDSPDSAISLYGTAETISTLYVASTTLTDNTYGMYISNATSTNISGVEISGGQYGIVASDSAMTIATSSIAGMTQKSVWNLTPDSMVLAENNWWGSATGPQHPTLNSTGLGAGVSDGVDFEPWLTYDPFNPPAPVAEEF